MRSKNEDGQAIILVALAMSIFLLGAVGLAIDGSHLYSQRQMAQAAADSAAIAGIMSIFDGTNTAGSAQFGTTTFTCTTTDAKTPCVYASKNGFGGSAGDTVTIDFPANTTAPGVTFATGYPATLIRATVARNVDTTLMRMLGTQVSTVQATAMAGIVSVFSPVPILVTHPTLPPGNPIQPPLKVQGTPTIKICGGPRRSIQVNSNYTGAILTGGNSAIDLSHAGPPDSGNCTTGTGADIGVWGAEANPGGITLGTTGHYIEQASPIRDPLFTVAAPDSTGFQNRTITTNIAPGVSGCPLTTSTTCTLYGPGLYPTGFDGKGQDVIFKPGIYYVQDGFQCSANCNLYMATGFTDSGAGTTQTGWTGNMLVYNTGTTSPVSPTQKCSNQNTTSYCEVNLGANGTISLVGSPGTSIYKGMLFFEDRNAPALSHTLGGGGAMSLVGTIYLTNPLATMAADASHYQELNLQGGSGSGTLVQGEIIVGTLHLGGNGNITMNLNPNATLVVSQVALVN